MSKIKIYGISISICAVFVSFLINSSYAQSDNFLNYTNNDLKFSIQHPSNWTVENGFLPDSVLFRISGEPNTMFGSYFIIHPEDVKSYLDTDTMTVKNASSQQYAQARLDPLSSPSHNMEVIRQNEVTVGGNSGWKIEFMIYDTPKDLFGAKYNSYFLEIYTVANGKPFRLAYVEDSLKVPETLPLANKMVESFKILK